VNAAPQMGEAYTFLNYTYASKYAKDHAGFVESCVVLKAMLHWSKEAKSTADGDGQFYDPRTIAMLEKYNKVYEVWVDQHVPNAVATAPLQEQMKDRKLSTENTNSEKDERMNSPNPNEAHQLVYIVEFTEYSLGKYIMVTGRTLLPSDVNKSEKRGPSDEPPSYKYHI